MDVLKSKLQPKHTPEPWCYQGGIEPVGVYNLFCCSITNASDEYRGIIADIQSPAHISGWITNEEAEANARRIVACVNACQGIPDEVLESGVINLLTEAAELAYFATTPPESQPELWDNRDRAIARLKEALAKLEGRQC